MELQTRDEKPSGDRPRRRRRRLRRNRRPSLHPTFLGWSVLIMLPANVLILFVILSAIGFNPLGLLIAGVTIVASVLLLAAELLDGSGYDPFR